MSSQKRLIITLIIAVICFIFLNLLLLFTLNPSLHLTGEAVSNNTGVASICINHPPTITSDSLQNAVIGTEYTLQLTVSDNDSALTYQDNTSLFAISSTGYISFVPLAVNFGTHSINITVIENTTCSNNNSTQVFQFSITGSIAGGTPSSGNGVCIPEWSCDEWSYCNADLQQARNCFETTLCGKNNFIQTRSCPVCQESWVCSLWSECANEQQIRACFDEHLCDAVTQKPVLEKSCLDTFVPGPQPGRIINVTPDKFFPSFPPGESILYSSRALVGRASGLVGGPVVLASLLWLLLLIIMILAYQYYSYKHNHHK